MKEFIEFIKSNWFVKQMLRALLLFVSIIFVVSIVLRIYTQHNRTREVPDFKGLPLTEALELANKNKLRVEVIDSVHVLNFKRGAVVEQSPMHGSQVKKGRKIFLTMNAMMPEKIPMPDVTEVSFRQAKAIIETYGLKVGRLIYRPHIAKDYVLEQRQNGKIINRGVLVIKGSDIDLVLGTGPTNEKTFIPKLTNLSISQAKERLSDALLNLGKVIADNSVLTREDSLKAIVYRQEPKYSEEAELSLGSFVYVWVTIDTVKISEINK